MSGPPRVRCPACGAPGAEVLFSLPRCVRDGCRYYDPDLELSYADAMKFFHWLGRENDQRVAR